MKKSYYLAIAILFSLNSVFGQAVATYGQLGVNGSNLVDQSGSPVQLQGMSLFWSNWDDGYDYWNEGVVTSLTNNACINVIRAAMGVDEENGYVTSSSNAATNLARVETVIDAAIANDIYVIVDYHSHYAHNYKSQAITFFKYIANKYGDKKNIIYEIYNEPLTGASWNNTIKPYSEDVIDEIRKIDANNVIIVGTRQWDQRPDEVVGNEIQNEINIAYAFHYYAGTHGTTEREYAQTAIDGGLCLFVSEYGTVNADGAGGVNTSSSNTWWDFIEANNLSHCNWSVSNKNEGASFLKSSVSNTTGNWSYPGDLSTSGTLVYNYLKAHCTTYGTTAPTITKQPISVEVFDGYDATFTVFASGGSLSYQWYKGTTALSGKTTNSLTITGATSANAGDYTVKVTNSAGNVTSSIAVLSISATSPYTTSGDPHPIPGKINVTDFDNGTNYMTTPSGASYNDSKVGNDVPSDETFYLNYRPETDGDFGTTWDPSINKDVNTLGYMSDGEWFNYTVNVTESGYYNIGLKGLTGGTATVAKVNLEIGGTDVTGDVSLPHVASYYPVEEVTVSNVYLAKGQQIMRLNILTAGESTMSDITFTISPDQDCNKELNGNASIDDCGVCSGGSTGKTKNSTCSQDCADIWGGLAYEDQCNDCVGGTTGKPACTVGINDVYESQLNAKAFPNPFKSILSVELEEGDSWEVTNSFGVLIKTGTESSINLEGYTSGMYIVRFNNGEVVKVIKQ